MIPFSLQRIEGHPLHLPESFQLLGSREEESNLNEDTAPPWSFVSMITSFTNEVVQHTVGDIPYLLWNSEKFITTNLYNRTAMTGIAQAYLGPKLLCMYGYLPTITLVSGVPDEVRPMILKVANYNDQDDASRDSFKIITELTGTRGIVNMVGAEAVAERKMIKHQLVGHEALNNAYGFTLEFIDEYFQSWDEDVSVQDHITSISSNIIGRCVFGVPYVPAKYAKLIQSTSRIVFNPQPDPAEVRQLAQQIRIMSDDLMSHEDAGKFGGYPFLQLKLTGNESPKEIVDGLKALNTGAGIVVEGNLSFLILSGILLISQDQDIQSRLREELYDFDWNQENAFDALCKLEYLDCVYTELLRHPSPVSMIDRQVSKFHTITGKDKDGNQPAYHIAGKSRLTPLFGNSHMMVCISGIHHDPRYWTNPNEFDPSRFEGENGQKLKKYIVPFSAGMRSCPAGSTEGTGFVAIVGKLILARFFMNYDLELHSKLNDVPNDKFYRRWETAYASVVARHEEFTG